MTRLTRLFAAFLAVVVTASPALAQKGAAPEVKIAHGGASKVLKDLESLLSLTTAKQQKQWRVLNENLQIFLIGIDHNKPLRVDLMFKDGGQVGFKTAFPVSNLKKFRYQNLKPFGIPTRRKAASLYQCKGAVYKGFMRYRHNYAVFSEFQSDLPLTMPNPMAGIANLLTEFDLGAHGVNHAVDGASIKKRRAWFDYQRKELLALVKQTKTESHSDFELRKLLMVQQLNEMERFYAETKELKTGWKMDLQSMTGQVTLDLTAIPGTELDKSAALLGTSPSYFTGVPRSDGTILSMRVNWPLDTMRQKHFLELFAAVQKNEEAKLNADDTLSKVQKDATREIGNIFVKILQANVAAGYFDAFGEVHPNSAGKNTALGAFRTVDGTKMVDILKLASKTGKGRSVKLDVAKVGDVRIHQVEMKLSQASLLRMFLGDGSVYVGTSKDAIWVGSGKGALEEMATAIKSRGVGAAVVTKDVFFDLYVKVAPWIELRDKARGMLGKPELRKLAKTAFSGGKDGVRFQLRCNNRHVQGTINVQTDVLRFAGALAAKFSEETLDDSSKKNKTNLKR